MIFSISLFILFFLSILYYFSIFNMEGRHFAILASILMYYISYSYTLYFLGTYYSDYFKRIKILKIVKRSFYINIFILTLILTPLLSSTFFYIGGIFEEGKGIMWGGYIEDFMLGSIYIWAIGIQFLTILLIIGLINPPKLGFSSRFKVLSMYFLHIFISFIVIFICSLAIKKINYSLSGIDSSCW